MESEEGEESRLARSSPEQPRPSTSRAVSPPQLDGPPSPKRPIIRDELSLPDSNHQTGDPEETGREWGWAAQAEACILSSRGWVGPLLCIPMPFPGSPRRAAFPVCLALSCHQTGKGKSRVCLGWGGAGARVDGLAHALLGCLCRERDGLGSTFL